jgi:hypothetical protein
MCVCVIVCVKKYGYKKNVLQMMYGFKGTPLKYFDMMGLEIIFSELIFHLM